MEEKTLIQYLTAPVEHERVLAVATLLDQIESYVRALGVAVTGLAVNVNPETMKEFCAVRRNADEVTAWLAAHRAVLDQYASLALNVSAAEAVPVKAEARDDQAQTIH